MGTDSYTLCVRGHDLGVKGTENIISRVHELGVDGIQLVCYKSYDDIAYAPGAITRDRAREIGEKLSLGGVFVPLLGAYFNPVHSNREKAKRCFDIFADYLAVARSFGCVYVGSETGSYNDEPWIYHPKNRTEEAYELVADTFGRLADIAAENCINIAMEGAAGHVCWSPDILDTVIGRMGRPNVKVIFDLYNYMDAQNQHDYLPILDRGLELFGDRILLFHMKDCVLHSDGSAPKQVGFGRGDLDKVEIIRRIKAAVPHPILVLEGTTGEDLPFAVKTIRDIWEKV